METGIERIAARMNEGGPPVSICLYCRHKRTGTPTCDAYPGGIPSGFLRGWQLHLDLTPGDNGIRFEMDDWVGEPLDDILARVGPQSQRPKKATTSPDDEPR